VTPFLELYGAWLGLGARLSFAGVAALEFAVGANESLAAFVTERLATLRVREWHATPSGVVRVTAPRWVDFFHAHYGHALGAEAPRRM
jgi:hypothetical protein